MENWVIEDLKSANTPEMREKYPFVIVGSHRPIYCLFNDEEKETKRCYDFYR